ncbi:MAG: MFS transporter [Agathobacter sp.]|nr:MFS transporter [Agathobacter sp.]
MNEKKNVRKFGMLDKIGYTLGDMGCCCTEQFRSAYLSVFFTLVLQINPLHSAALFLITKIWDAVNDPIIGALVDSKKDTGKGKFIPWIRAFAIPMAVVCVLGFYDTSNWAYSARLIYAFVSYVVYEIMYTCVNVPYGSLSAVMTDDVNQRTDLSRYRSLGGTIFMTVAVILGPLLLYKDNQPVPERFIIVAAGFAAVGVVCLMLTSFWCKERVVAESLVKEDKKFNISDVVAVVKEIASNRALIGCMLASFIGMVGASVVNGLNTYLYKDYFGDVKLSAMSGMLSVVWSAIAFIGIKFTAKKFGKKEWIMGSALFSVIVYGVLHFFPITDGMTFIIVNGICYLGVSGFQVLVWALVNDSIDYHELIHGKRNEGIVYSAYSFVRKCANALSASLANVALFLVGYDVTASVQSETVTKSIWSWYTILYVVGYALAVAVLYFVYPLTKKKTQEMIDTLAERRAAKGAQ